MTETITSAYLHRVLAPDTWPRVIEDTVKRLQDELSPDQFDAIAFRGMSGALVAPAVAAQLGKPLILVRKGEASHGFAEEGALSAERYVIVDDFVSSGETVRTIRRTLKGRCVGVVVWRGWDETLDGVPVWGRR